MIRKIAFLVALCAVQLSHGMENLDQQLVDASVGGHVDMVRLLLAHGVSANARASYGTPALHLAMVNRREDVCRLLLAHGADCNATTRDFKITPLMCAVEVKNFRLCELLLQYGADPEMRDLNNKRAIDCDPSDRMRALLSDPEKIHAVIMRENNPNLKKLRRFGPNIVNTLMIREIGGK